MDVFKVSLFAFLALACSVALGTSESNGDCGERPGVPPGFPSGILCDPDGPLIEVPPGWTYSHRISTHYFTGNYADSQSGVVVEFKVGPKTHFEERPCRAPRGGVSSKGRIQGVRYCRILLDEYRS